MHIAICDDNVLHLTSIKEIIREKFEVLFQISVFTHPAKLMKAMSETFFEILILDICFPQGDNGITLAKQAGRLSPNSSIIFVTGYECYTLEVYEAPHIYFVLKTQINDRLPHALQKAIEQQQQMESKPLLVQSGSKKYILQQSSIWYLERSLRVTGIHYGEQCTEEVHTTEPLAALMGRLDTQRFLQCHRSFIVNKRYLHTVERKQVTLYNGLQISVSRAYWDDVKSFLYQSEPVC